MWITFKNSKAGDRITAHRAEWTMRAFAVILPVGLLLVACTGRMADIPAERTGHLESRTNNAAVRGGMLFVGMAEEDALRRLRLSGAREHEMETFPVVKGWAVSGSHDTVVLSFNSGVLSSIAVEENSDQPKNRRKWYSINAYSLP